MRSQHFTCCRCLKLMLRQLRSLGCCYLATTLRLAFGRRYAQAARPAALLIKMETNIVPFVSSCSFAVATQACCKMLRLLQKQRASRTVLAGCALLRQELMLRLAFWAGARPHATLRKLRSAFKIELKKMLWQS